MERLCLSPKISVTTFLKKAGAIEEGREKVCPPEALYYRLIPIVALEVWD